MATQTFHLFPDLPGELRREIWEWTFEPRLIPLHCEFQRVDERDPPRFVHQVPYQPFFGTLPTLKSTRTRKGEKTAIPGGFFSAFLIIQEDFPTLLASVVCRESREWARLDGYLSMKMHNAERETRNILWNPKHDIVDFNTRHDKNVTIGALPLLSIFTAQFPFETTELRYLNLPTWFWPARMHDARQITWSLIDYISLRELTVVVDREFEKERVMGFDEETKFGHASLVWTLPDDIQQNIENIRDHYEKWGPERNPLPKKPAVRVVMSTNGIFDGEDRHINLRCKPCPLLGV